jgi:hypothetical protein
MTKASNSIDDFRLPCVIIGGIAWMSKTVFGTVLREGLKTKDCF